MCETCGSQWFIAKDCFVKKQRQSAPSRNIRPVGLFESHEGETPEDDHDDNS